MRFLAVALAAVLAAPAFAQPAPEAATGRTVKRAVHASRHMIVAAHPLASQAGLQVLRAGGSALDAALAAQLVLNVVEPQSSGIGGGAFLLHYERAADRLTVYDGRETAPAAARASRFLDAEGRPLRYLQAVGSGLSVGTPGLVRMMELAHSKHGKLRWEKLFEPAIRVADDGFAVTPRLERLIARDPLLKQDPGAFALFYRPDGSGLRTGDHLRNPELAKTFRILAAGGAGAFYQGSLALDIVEAVQRHRVPGDLSLTDLAAYRARERSALCADYRRHKVCGVPPPSAGGTTVAMMLGLLERFPLHELSPTAAESVHLFTEAGRLAYADRDRYLADPDFVPAPVAQLLDRRYIAERSSLISETKTLGVATPGTLRNLSTRYGEDHTAELPATTHVSVVDAQGNAVALTSSIESAFGSRVLVRGFLLNNQLTDFSYLPNVAGAPAANRVEPGKRPRSSMAPTMVFDAQGLRHLLGSPGGNDIINYVALSLVGLIDWRLDAQQALDLPRYGSRGRVTELENVPALQRLVPRLTALGHETRLVEQASGLHAISIGKGRLTGGADPRREGLAVGD